jgi:hypothetical protein
MNQANQFKSRVRDFWHVRSVASTLMPAIFAAFATAFICLPKGAGAAEPADKKPADVAAKPAEAPKRIAQAADGSVVLAAHDVTIHGAKVRYEPDKNTIGYWTRAEDWVSWELEIKQPGQFQVELLGACGEGSGNSRYVLEIGDQKLEDKVPETGSFRTFRLRKIGVVQIDRPGNYTLSIHPTSKPGLAVMDLRTVALKPVKPEANKPPDSIPNPPGINRTDKPTDKPAGKSTEKPAP